MKSRIKIRKGRTAALAGGCPVGVKRLQEDLQLGEHVANQTAGGDAAPIHGLCKTDVWLEAMSEVKSKPRRSDIGSGKLNPG
jgi:hypothetical protein